LWYSHFYLIHFGALTFLCFSPIVLIFVADLYPWPFLVARFELEVGGSSASRQRPLPYHSDEAGKHQKVISSLLSPIRLVRVYMLLLPCLALIRIARGGCGFGFTPRSCFGGAPSAYQNAHRL
jgi:hypothetical protein